MSCVEHGSPSLRSLMGDDAVTVSTAHHTLCDLLFESLDAIHRSNEGREVSGLGDVAQVVKLQNSNVDLPTIHAGVFEKIEADPLLALGPSYCVSTSHECSMGWLVLLVVPFRPRLVALSTPRLKTIWRSLLPSEGFQRFALTTLRTTLHGFYPSGFELQSRSGPRIRTSTILFQRQACCHYTSPEGGRIRAPDRPVVRGASQPCTLPP